MHSLTIKAQDGRSTTYTTTELRRLAAIAVKQADRTARLFAYSVQVTDAGVSLHASYSRRDRTQSFTSVAI